MTTPKLITAYFILFTLLATSNVRAEDPRLLQKATELKLSTSTEWLRLVHYQKKLLGGVESQIDGESFFLDPNGKNDPDAELKATLLAFQMPLTQFPKDQSTDLVLKPEDVPFLHPLCRFPARAIFLGQKLGANFYELVQPRCLHYEDFKKRMDAKSATLVFSSFFLGSPSSTFGHTFIQIRSHRAEGDRGERVELLDHGINYAAIMTTSNPLLYAIYGLVGAFKGNFTSVPFYFKVREYNDFESRDLWSYDLNLTSEEIKMMVAHIWELGFTYYDYFYFTENCSYHMFTLLEAAAPRLELIDRLPFYVIPSDTVRSIIEVPNLVGKIYYRPSNRAQFEKRLSLLTNEQKQSLKEIAVKRNLSAYQQLPATVSAEEKAKILDTSLDYIEFSNPEDIVKESSENSKFKQELLIERAKLGIKSAPLNIEPETRLKPHVSHGIRRTALNFGSETNRGQSLRLGMRFALHDALDPSPGYPPLAEIEFMHLKTRYEFDHKSFNLDEITLFRVLALSPYDSFHHKPSYRVQLGYSKFRGEGQCKEFRCYGPEFDVAFGLSFTLLGQNEHPALAAFVLPEMQNQISTGFRASAYHLSLGARAGLLGELSEYSHFKLELHPAHFFFSAKSFNFDTTLEWRQNPSLYFGYGLQIQSLESKMKNYDYSAQVFYYF